MIESKIQAPRHASSQASSPAAVLADMESAFEELRAYMAELAQVIDQPELDRARLTTVRLKIAKLRLARGSILGSISTCLAGNVNASEAELLKELRAGHDRMMRIASEHTGRWTLDAIEADWPEYRKATSQIFQYWMEKVMWEQEVLQPLLKRAVKAAA